jgi:hypothetical protein
MANEDPLRSPKYTLRNIFVPLSSIILCIIKAFEPQTAVWFRQMKIKCCKGKKITPEEWRKYINNGKQLDTVMAQSMFIEAIYLILR